MKPLPLALATLTMMSLLMTSCFYAQVSDPPPSHLPGFLPWLHPDHPPTHPGALPFHENCVPLLDHSCLLHRGIRGGGRLLRVRSDPVFPLQA